MGPQIGLEINFKNVRKICTSLWAKVTGVWPMHLLSYFSLYIYFIYQNSEVKPSLVKFHVFCKTGEEELGYELVRLRNDHEPFDT
jgi:hypothetical protein